ncbi:complement factor H-related protein 2-like [Eleutherodactylus coqui]|uniref:complement factor H-related protein 2-like n=1 Tax=Eleutherodactylus coqui TaxID=57060 RepID=UPI003462B052
MFYHKCGILREKQLYANLPSHSQQLNRHGKVSMVYEQPIQIRKRCPKPGGIEGARLEGEWKEETYPPGKIANYACLPGYAQDAPIKMACVEGTWWPIAKGQCKDRCPKPEGIEGVQLQGEWKEETYPPGKVANFACLPGYTQDGPIKMACAEGTWWPIAKGECKVTKCPPVKAAKNVTIVSTSYDKEYSVGQVVRFECNDTNLKLRGASEIFCTSEGKWNLKPPKCVASCTVQQNDMREHNVRLKDNRGLNYRDNEDVQFQCISGYNITDPAELMIKCNNGILKYPDCYKIGSCFIYAEKMNENRIRVLWNKQKKKSCTGNLRIPDKRCVFQHDETVHFECLPGSVIYIPRKLKSKCLGGNLPYPKCFEE